MSTPPDELAERLRTSLSGRYEVEREIGRGGMATVYLARDVRHGRSVAIKVLHPELGLSLGPERFLREIQIAARLQHPHIVPLYDSGQAGDLLYYVMPFVEGESLRQRLQQEGRLPLEEALAVTRAVASALDYAHRQQVVHRDIKPENVMLHDGEAMVTDFGIAKAVSAAADTLTRTGTSVGTPQYMSPEQAGGEAEIDGRSDIYSLATMLYEMLTGTVPFTGSQQAIMAQLFTAPVPSLRQRRDDVSNTLEQVVQRALAKEPGQRYPTPAQFAAALGAPEILTPTSNLAASSGGKSIAVLPFANMSADPENEYFTDGIAEEIINALTKVQALHVAARTSAFAFKGKNQDIRKVGEQLGVTTVLEGSVRKAGNRLRVTAQLVNVADGYHLWSERYDRQMDDVFAIQDEISENIVKALRVVLSDKEKRQIEKKPPTENLEAYEYYLRGRQYFHQFRRTSIQYARRMFERAVEVDPNFARAYAGIADCCSFLYQHWDGSKANLDVANAASQKALELDADLADAHASRGFALSLSNEFEEAREEFERAIELNPKLYEAHYLYARACVKEGRREDAVRHYAEAARIRPEDYQALSLSTGPLRALGREAEADEALNKVRQVVEHHLELNPDDVRALYLGAGALMQLGERDRAIEWAQRAYSIDSTDSATLYNLACVYAQGAMPDRALECLESAVENGFGYREWLENDTDLDSLRSDPRFKALQQRL